MRGFSYMANAQQTMIHGWRMDVKMVEMPVARHRIMDRIPSLETRQMSVYLHNVCRNLTPDARAYSQRQEDVHRRLVERTRVASEAYHCP